MGKTVFICDGQGAVQPNAGEDLYNENVAFRESFDAINRILDIDNIDISWGSLSRRVKTDPHLSHAYAISHEYALFKMLMSRNVPCDLVTGHSLGEMVALVLSEAVSLEQGVRLIESRGKLFKRNSTSSVRSDMVALIGDRETSLKLVYEMKESIDIFVANINSDSQIVVSISSGDMGFVFKHSLASGIRPVGLNLGNGCHSLFVESIHDELSSVIEDLDFRCPKIPFFSASSGSFISSPDQLRDHLIKHLLEPVDWLGSMRSLLDSGARTFYEIGQSKILKSFLSDIDRASVVYTVQQYKSEEHSFELSEVAV